MITICEPCLFYRIVSLLPYPISISMDGEEIKIIKSYDNHAKCEWIGHAPINHAPYYELKEELEAAKREATKNKLLERGYDLDELDKDNPYVNWHLTYMEELWN